VWQCPKCGLEVEDSLKWCWICGTQRDTAAEAEIPLAWVVAEGVPEPTQATQTVGVGNDPGVERVRREAGVPRRFGVGKLLLITAFFAVVFAVLRCLNAPWLLFVGVAGFVTIIGLSQAILYSGRRPRRASVVTGAVLGGLVPAVGFLVLLFSERPHLAMDDLAGGAFFVAVGTLIYAVIGGGLGYMAGCLIAGMFLGKGSTLPETEEHSPESADPFCSDDPKLGPPDDPPGA
jgi:hypothetical protein